MRSARVGESGEGLAEAGSLDRVEAGYKDVAADAAEAGGRHVDPA